MRRQERDLVLDFLTLAIAVFWLGGGVAAFATAFKSKEVQDRVFTELFTYSSFSIVVFYSLFHLIRYLLSFKFSMPDRASGVLWFPTIILGTILFTCFAFDSFFFGHFEPTFGCLLAALIPAAIFRLTVNFVISYWQEKKDPAKLSIIN